MNTLLKKFIKHFLRKTQYYLSFYFLDFKVLLFFHSYQYSIVIYLKICYRSHDYAYIQQDMHTIYVYLCTYIF